MKHNAYTKLERRFRRLLAIRDAEAMLHWDLATMMPPGGASGRGEQLAELRAVQHGILSAPETGALIADAAALDLSPGQAADLGEMKRTWARAVALPEDMVTAMSRACSACETVWRKARPEADFAAILPTLEDVLARVRETAAILSDALELSPYDALLDEYEPGGRSADLGAVFADLESFLPGFLAGALDHQASQPRAIPLPGPFPIEAQRQLGIGFMKRLGFDFNHGRLDVSLHPFCGGTRGDVRITTRYDEADFTSSLMGVMHETGHALYDMGLPTDWRGHLAGEARGMSLHESQSLLIEMQVCRSPEFLAFAAPIMAKAFGGSGPAWETQNLIRLYTQVQPGFIRVDADEVTYPAHVILRYRLERAMIEGDMEARDLPAAFNEGMEKLLGITPPDDGLGCLQDLHWYDGAWGYFPTYTLGAMTAAQLFAAAKTADPTIKPAIAQGNFTPLMSWLRQNVHAKASLHSTRDIITAATGKPLDTQVFKTHLKSRYLPQ